MYSSVQEPSTEPSSPQVNHLNISPGRITRISPDHRKKFMPPSSTKPLKRIEPQPRNLFDEVSGLSYDEAFKPRPKIVDDRSSSLSRPTSSLSQASQTDTTNTISSRSMTPTPLKLDSTHHDQDDIIGDTNSVSLFQSQMRSANLNTGEQQMKEFNILETELISSMPKEPIINNWTSSTMHATSISLPSKSNIRSNQQETPSFQQSSSPQGEPLDEDNFDSHILRSSSELIELSFSEQTELEKHQLQIQDLDRLTRRVDKLTRQMRDLKKCLREMVETEDARIEASVIKIQAWFRGCLERKRLASQSIRFAKKEKRHDSNITSPFLSWAVSHPQIVTLLQAKWRGKCARKKTSTLLEIRYLRKKVTSQESTISSLKSEVESLRSQFSTYEVQMKKWMTLSPALETLLSAQENSNASRS